MKVYGGCTLINNLMFPLNSVVANLTVECNKLWFASEIDTFKSDEIFSEHDKNKESIYNDYFLFLTALDTHIEIQ